MGHSEKQVGAAAAAALGAQSRVESRKCGKHGDFQATVFMVAGREVGGICPKCMTEKEAAEAAERAERNRVESRRNRVHEMFGRAEIPERFRDRGFGNYEAVTESQKENYAVCREYATDFLAMRADGRCLVLTGNPGTGKTHLAIAIARAVMKDGGDALYARAYEVIQSVKETYGKESTRTEREVIAEFVRHDLLVMDEIGVQFGTDAEKVILYAIINGRYDKGLPTILVSNLDVVEIESFIGDRAFDRLRENGGRVLRFKWDSYRKTGSAT